MCAGQRVVQDTDGLEHVASDLHLALKVARVSQDHLALCRKGDWLIAHVVHGRFDTRGAAIFVLDFINGGTQHIGSPIDCRQSSKALRQLTKTIKRVDVWRFSVTGNRVSVELDPLNGFGRSSLFCNVRIRLVKSHGVPDKVARASLETKLVVNVLHRAGAEVQACSHEYCEWTSAKRAYLYYLPELPC